MSEFTLLDQKSKIKGRRFVQFRRVVPTAPLQMIEMDIKHIWIEGFQRQAYVLTILDTFTRYALHWSVGLSMKSAQVQSAWSYVIAEFLQMKGICPKDVTVEVRTDNGSQFIAQILRKYFEENSINHVFTKPYTPEENGHVESFHSILSKSLGRDTFTSLHALEKRLQKFYTCYDNDRAHSGTKGIPPAKFWALYDMDMIEVVPLEKHRVGIKIKVPYQNILAMPGINKYDYRAILIGEKTLASPEIPSMGISGDKESIGRPTQYSDNHRCKTDHRLTLAEANV
jgi:hypothetical protein